MDEKIDVGNLMQRVRELEEKVEQLRLSRRVLMYLIEKIEKEKLCFLTKLEKENNRLHQDNCRYAHRLLRKNSKIIELQSKLENYSTESSPAEI
ncbi:MAG: translation initiation factor 2 [Desulfotomaculaceae bacterium]|nr:translation initiation factor 2 [Desulfotomaculaceae bacterium]